MIETPVMIPNVPSDPINSCLRSYPKPSSEAMSAPPSRSTRLRKKRTRVVLAQRSSPPTRHPNRKHRALLIWKDDLEPQNCPVETPVPEETQPSSVRREVAGNVARALGAEVERHHVPLGREIRREGLENRAAVGRQDPWAPQGKNAFFSDRRSGLRRGEQTHRRRRQSA